MEREGCQAGIPLREKPHSHGPLCQRPFPLVSILVAPQRLRAEELSLAVVAGEDSGDGGCCGVRLRGRFIAALAGA